MQPKLFLSSFEQYIYTVDSFFHLLKYFFFFLVNSDEVFLCSLQDCPIRYSKNIPTYCAFMITNEMFSHIPQLKNNPQHAPYYELLHLFAYGVYGDYVRESSKFPSLTPTMLTKLRHLTIVSMATGQKSIPLVTLGNQLGLASTRELEDLIIEAMYTGKGK